MSPSRRSRHVPYLGTKMKETIELPSLRNVTIVYKKPKELDRQMLFAIDFRPNLKDAPARTREIPKTLIQETTRRSDSAGKPAVSSIPFSNISIER